MAIELEHHGQRIMDPVRFAERMLRARLRHEHPHASSEEIEAMLEARRASVSAPLEPEARGPQETPELRLRRTLELAELGESMARARFRRKHPSASKAELAALLAAWFADRPGAEHGDGVGTPVAWPRRRP